MWGWVFLNGFTQCVRRCRGCQVGLPESLLGRDSANSVLAPTLQGLRLWDSLLVRKCPHVEAENKICNN